MRVPTAWYRELGRKGGKASGKCKVRGDRDYYVNLRLKGQQKKEEKTP